MRHETIGELANGARSAPHDTAQALKPLGNWLGMGDAIGRGMASTKYKVSQSGPVTMPACDSTDRDFRMGFFAAWSIEASLTEFLGCSAVGLRAAAGSRYARTFGVERGSKWLAGSKAYQATRTAVSL